MLNPVINIPPYLANNTSLVIRPEQIVTAQAANSNEAAFLKEIQSQQFLEPGEAIIESYNDTVELASNILIPNEVDNTIPAISVRAQQLIDLNTLQKDIDLISQASSPVSDASIPLSPEASTVDLSTEAEIIAYRPAIVNSNPIQLSMSTMALAMNLIAAQQLSTTHSNENVASIDDDLVVLPITASTRAGIR